MNFANANGSFSNATLSYLIMMIIFIQTAFSFPFVAQNLIKRLTRITYIKYILTAIGS